MKYKNNDFFELNLSFMTIVQEQTHRNLVVISTMLTILVASLTIYTFYKNYQKEKATQK